MQNIKRVKMKVQSDYQAHRMISYDWNMGAKLETNRGTFLRLSDAEIENMLCQWERKDDVRLFF
jgi:hypothetical protein